MAVSITVIKSVIPVFLLGCVLAPLSLMRGAGSASEWLPGPDFKKFTLRSTFPGFVITGLLEGWIFFSLFSLFLFSNLIGFCNFLYCFLSSACLGSFDLPFLVLAVGT